MVPVAAVVKVAVCPIQAVKSDGWVLIVMVAVEPTVKTPLLIAVLHPTVTEIVPVVAPTGTVVVMLVTVLAVTTAAVPLNFTMLLPGVVAKLVPVMVTAVPIAPDVGVKEEIVMGETLAMVLRNTDTLLLPPKFAVARSALPSPSKSPIETD